MRRSSNYRCLPYRWIVFIARMKTPNAATYVLHPSRATLIPAVSIQMARLLLAAWKIIPGKMDPVISAIAVRITPSRAVGAIRKSV